MNITKNKCSKCGYNWYYKGNKTESTCPKCRKWVKITKPANAGKKHKKMTPEDMLKQTHYSSILNLTRLFGNNKGLQQLHYRWELIENHDNIKQTYFVKKMEKFFDNSDLNKIYNSILYKKNSVSSRSNLSNFLTRLVDEYLLQREPDSNGISRYHLTQRGELYLLKHNLMNMVDLTPIQHIKKVYLDISNILLDNNEFLISKKKIEEMYYATDEEIKEILNTDLKNVSDEEKHWVRHQVDSRSDKDKEKEYV